jgi:hypothetical protein
MGRASVALGAPDSSSGIMDGSVIGIRLFDTESGRSSPFGVDRIGQSLWQPEASESALRQQHAHQAEKEVVCQQLWFQLSLDERTQFGSCFSRMILKCLSETDQEDQEVRT